MKKFSKVTGIKINEEPNRPRRDKLRKNSDRETPDFIADFEPIRE